MMDHSNFSRCPVLYTFSKSDLTGALRLRDTSATKRQALDGERSCLKNRKDGAGRRVYALVNNRAEGNARHRGGTCGDAAGLELLGY